MASTGEHQTETVGLPAVGQEGETCEQCGSVLATDQRYCLNCGRRRGESRVDYEQRLNGGTYTPNGATATAAASGTQQQWTPAFAILAIALLGVFLLLGVLIGKKGNNNTQTVAAQAAPTTTSAAAAPTNTTATTASKTAKSGKGGGASAPGQGNVVQGGSGSTQGIQAANTGASTQQNAKSGPNVVATQGQPAQLDPNGQAGGGSSATCIGC
jgi:uncharacterized OB-fold protein